LSQTRITPPLKWAGGKRWLISRYPGLFPANFNRYIEPFVGSGAVYFSLKPRSALLADRNDELINFYTAVQHDPALLLRKLRVHARRHSAQYYYRVREDVPVAQYERAARFLYLNRTCWNGLYRENRQGKFNVPIGTKTNVLLPTDDFVALSSLLKTAKLMPSDFEPVLELAKSGDFLFVDPPYTATHNNNGFIKYNQHIFQWEDQKRLARAIGRAVRRGVQVLATNANHDAIKNLYKGYEQLVVDRSSVIAGASSARARYEEVIVKCF
jgi:DNA adenine methylase